MSWFFIALIAPALWAMVNYIDEYLLKETNLSPLTLSIFSGVVGSLLSMGYIFFAQPGSIMFIPLYDTALLFLSGVSVFLFIYFNLSALKHGEASVVSPLFLMSIIFGYVLGIIFLGELVEAKRVFGSILIMLGAYVIVVKQKNKIFGGIRSNILYLMILSSFFAASNSILFRFVAEPYGDEMFWTMFFWQYVGIATATLLVILGIILFQKKKTLKREIKQITHGGVFGLIGNIFNEILTIVGDTALNFSLLFAPVALVITVTEGFQPFFVILYGVLLARIFPRVFRENGKRLQAKILAVVLMVIGAVLLLV